MGWTTQQISAGFGRVIDLGQLLSHESVSFFLSLLLIIFFPAAGGVLTG